MCALMGWQAEPRQPVVHGARAAVGRAAGERGVLRRSGAATGLDGRQQTGGGAVRQQPPEGGGPPAPTDQQGQVRRRQTNRDR